MEARRVPSEGRSGKSRIQEEKRELKGAEDAREALDFVRKQRKIAHAVRSKSKEGAERFSIDPNMRKAVP